MNEQDKKRRKWVKAKLFERKQLQSLLVQKDLPSPIRKQAEKRWKKLPLNSNPIRVRNRCIQTGRSRSILRLFKLSRIEFRRRAALGLIPGIRKASW